MYSINLHVCYFTQIALTVILLCCFQCCSQEFGCSDGDTDSDGTPCKPFALNCCLVDRSKVRTASMCICVILLKSLSRSFCSAVFNVAARILASVMVMPTAMAQVIAHRYV